MNPSSQSWIIDTPSNYNCSFVFYIPPISKLNQIAVDHNL